MIMVLYPVSRPSTEQKPKKVIVQAQSNPVLIITPNKPAGEASIAQILP
jgi:hypothetical protein